ncbi:4-hydroxy-3-methylbut-2-en-1-yl diphosphate synthase IspG/GcpE [Crossiella equi]|uniref:4-hydroxy-3-methylbut-2-en-1-yl diphosphate synthase IspG/GcpE n=1 Tax=Crossiella equi TaxID=130796 RepID=A0ABS5APN0_9PSEU|nr:flavodoxin-dependent (E)-4-hydroxy-3-methylbut-2-enyl-diphosphate synthase [Crossiella equi]MBP2478538.1 4-hydroxy-3-methylbut-2-en-1-yl diphosphate synthase IspG/GcpE [Crossiella equi]
MADGGPRRYTRPVRLGPVALGAPHPVAVHAAAEGTDPEALLTVAVQAAAAGGEVLRVVRADRVGAAGLAELVRGCPVPVVAEIPPEGAAVDRAAEAGCAGVRVVVEERSLRLHAAELARTALATGLPVELAVAERPGQGALGLAEAGLRACALLAAHGLTAVQLAVSCAQPAVVLAAARLLAVACQHPLQFALTAAGGAATARAAAVCGQLLAEGIGDSVWLPSAGDAVMQAFVGTQVLRALQDG